MQVEIRNYKTIKHLKFEFDGFASIVGQNYIGKSGIVGAIVSCLTNSVDKSAVRDGESFIEVTIQRKDLHIHWHYEEGNTYYLINGEEYKKLNGSVPPPIIDAGYGPLTVADEKAYLWYIEQFLPFFVVDKDRSNFSTDLLASIFKFDSVYKALDMCRKEIRETNSLVKSDNLSLLAAQDALAPALPLENILEDIAGTQSAVASIEAVDTELHLVDSWITEIEASKKALTRLIRVTDIPKPDICQAQSASDDLEKVSRLAAAFNSAVQAYTKTKPVTALEKAPSVDSVGEILPALVRIEELIDTLATTSSQVNSLSRVESLPSAPSLKFVTDSMEGLKVISDMTSSLNEAKESYVKLQAVKSLPGASSLDTVEGILSDLRSISSMLSSLSTYATQVSDLKKEMAAVAVDQESVLKQLSEFHACPLCGKGFEASEVVHAH